MLFAMSYDTDFTPRFRSACQFSTFVRSGSGMRERSWYVVEEESLDCRSRPLRSHPAHQNLKTIDEGE